MSLLLVVEVPVSMSSRGRRRWVAEESEGEGEAIGKARAVYVGKASCCVAGALSVQEEEAREA